MDIAATTSERQSEGREVGRTAARGTAKLMLAQAISMASGYVVAVVLARGLGPDAYGVYGIVLSVLLATELIGRLGIPQVTSKLIAEGRRDVRLLERTSLTLTLGVYLSLAILFALAAPLLARSFGIDGGARLFLIAALDIPFYGMLFATQHVLNGERRFGAESLGISLYGISKAGGVLALLVIGVSIESALVVNVLASGVGLTFFVSRLAPGVFRPSLALAGPILRMAVPTSLIVFASQVLANLDLWCLKWMAGTERVGIAVTTDETIGLYVAATNIARLPNVVSFVMVAVLIPSVARLAAGGDTDAVRNVVRAASRFLMLLLAPACAWLALRSEELMRLVYDEQYVAGATFQALLVIRFGLLSTLVMTVSSVLLALGKPGLAARSLLLSIPLGGLLVVGAIHGLGANGAALGALFTMGFVVLFLGSSLRREIGPLLEGRVVLLAGASIAAVTLVTRLYRLDSWLLALDGLACLGLVLLLVFLLGGMKPRDLAAFLGRGGKS